MRNGRKTSVYVNDEDRQKLAALGMSATDVIREFCATRGIDGMPIDRYKAARKEAGKVKTVMVPSIYRKRANLIISVCPGSRDPSDGQPDKPPVKAHGWIRQGARHIARPASLDELARLVSTAPGPVRLAASHVLIVAEVNDG